MSDPRESPPSESLVAPRTEARVLGIPSLKKKAAQSPLGEAKARPELTEEQSYAALRVQELVKGMATPKMPPPDTPSFLLRIEPERESRIILIDGDRGSGKTSVLLTLIDLWNRQLLQQDGAAEPGPVIPLFAIGVIELQPLPPSTNLILHLASTLRRVIEKIEDGPESEASTQPWHPVRQQELRSRTCWRKFLGAAVAWSDATLQQHRELDPEALAVELEHAELERLDVNTAFYQLVDALVKDLADWRMIPGRQQPFLILSIDDADMNPHFSVTLLNLLRSLYHPRLGYLLTGYSELFLTMLHMHFLGALSHPIEGKALSRSDMDDLQYESERLAGKTYDRVIPDRQRCRIEELSPRTRLEKLKDALQRVPLSTLAPGNFKRILMYFARVPEMALALPDTMREIVDLHEDLMLRTTAGEADAGGRPAAWLVKHLWDRAVRAAFPAREDRRVLESRVIVTEQNNLRVDADYIHWSLTRGCISNFWSSGGELGLCIPIRRPGLFEKYTA